MLDFMPRGYRNSSMPAETASFTRAEQTVVVHYRSMRGGGSEIDTFVDETQIGSTVSASVIEVDLAEGTIVIETDGVRSTCHVIATDGAVVVQAPAGSVELVAVSRFPDYTAVDVAGGQTAPMPGKVLSVHVAAGDQVTAGQPLVIMEAMKMEHTITAPVDSVVGELRCAVGDQVDNGQVLVVLEEVT